LRSAAHNSAGACAGAVWLRVLATAPYSEQTRDQKPLSASGDFAGRAACSPTCFCAFAREKSPSCTPRSYTEKCLNQTKERVTASVRRNHHPGRTASQPEERLILHPEEPVYRLHRAV